MVLDPSSNLGRLRLRVGDVKDFPLLPDAVYQQALLDCNNSLTRATKLCAQYICALLSQNTHQKLAQIEVWDSDAFKQYLQYIQAVILNPQLSDLVAVPYSGGIQNQNPLIQFMQDWNNSYVAGTQSDLLHLQANSNSLP